MLFLEEKYVIGPTRLGSTVYRSAKFDDWYQENIM